jgi:hypothetical protein
MGTTEVEGLNAQTKELSDLNHDYLAYFGRYEIDTDKQVVRHFVEGATLSRRSPWGA